MDPVSLVADALAAGVSAGLSDSAKSAIGDLYSRIKARVAGRPVALATLEEHSADPDVWAKPLAKELAIAGIGTDADVVALAGRVMALVDPVGSAAGKYIVNLAGAQGVQVGDHNTQTNAFDA